jgi:hypothetical protein
MLSKPSFLAGGLNGLFMLIAFILIIKNWSELKSLDSYLLIILIVFISIAFGIHSLVHLGLESVYKWNPIETKQLI